MNSPGGQVLVGTGGFLQFWNWNVPSGNTGSTITPINYQYLDVAHYQLERTWIAPPLWFSGCFGALRRRLVAADWKLTARVWWDPQFPPETVLTQGDTLAVKATLGDVATWTGTQEQRAADFQATPADILNLQVNGLPPTGRGLLTQGGGFIPFYSSPMGKVELFKTSDSSEGGEDDGIVISDIVVSGDSLMWYIDDDQAHDDYKGYLNQLVQQNMVAGNA